ncbi:hypothetical protein FOL47_005257 [Perkinsus chesapeaki]|uniref:Sugar phosphate transporter domain-containing protein n=1 Tax=Perkinsus chesapeaki TaxID=330153 RepID=A0A7J6LY18_PERCH|nr:hypothetical protein FOL47_005257 [Perkinsus chesapeaki]
MSIDRKWHRKLSPYLHPCIKVNPLCVQSQTAKTVLMVIIWYAAATFSNTFCKRLVSLYKVSPLTLTMVDAVPALLLLKRDPKSRKIYRDNWKALLVISLFATSATLLHRISLTYAHVSTIHTAKATQPLISAVLSGVFLGEHITGEMAMSLVLIVVGVVMGTLKGKGPKVADQLEPSTAAGVTLALCGTVCTAINGINMKKIWHNDREITKSMIFSVSRTIAACIFFPVWLIRDVPKIRDGSLGNPLDGQTALALALYSIVMVTQHLSSLSVLHVLSPVSHSVLNGLKRVVVIAVSCYIFGNSLSFTNWIGIGICTAAVIWYSRLKMAAPKKNEGYSAVEMTGGAIVGSDSDNGNETIASRRNPPSPETSDNDSPEGQLERLDKIVNKRVRRFVIASPFLLYLVAWECVVWRRKRFYVKQRKNFTGDTPFYGKAWGMETDYLLELALNDGDLIVVCYDPEALHWPVAMGFYLKTLLLGRAVGEGWNRIGIVCRKGSETWVHFAEGPELYGEVLADYRVSYVAVRKLQFADEVRAGLPGVIRAVREEQLTNSLPYTDVWRRWNDMWHRRGGPESLGDDPVVKQIAKELDKSHKRHDLREMIREMEEVIDITDSPAAKAKLEETLKASVDRAEKELIEIGHEDDCGLMKGSLGHDAGFVGRVFQRLGLLPSNINLRLMTPNDFMRMMRLRAQDGEPPTGSDLGKAYFVREANYEFFADYTLKNFKIEWENLKVDDRNYSSKNSSADSSCYDLLLTKIHRCSEDRKYSLVCRLLMSQTGHSLPSQSMAMVSDLPYELKGVQTCDLIRYWPLKRHSRTSHECDLHTKSRPVKSLDMFISHTWSTPPYVKFGCLALRCNTMWAFVLALVTGVTMQSLEMPVAFIFVAMWLALLVGYAFGGYLCFDRRTIFYDQFCIHQSNERKKLEGIRNIGNYLARSDKLVIFWSADYNERLWCIFELACFLRTDASRNVEIWPLLILENRVRIMSLQQLYWALRIAVGGSGLVPGWIVDLLFSLYTGYFCLFIDGKPRLKLQRDLTTISAKTLHCYLPADRVMIMEHINRLYGDFETFRESAKALFAHLFSQWGANEYSLRITLVTAFPMICATMLTGRMITGIVVTALRILLHIIFYCIYGTGAVLGCCSMGARNVCRFGCFCMSVLHSLVLTKVWKFEDSFTSKPGLGICFVAVMVQMMVILFLKKILLLLTQRPHRYVDHMCEWLL